VLSERSRTARKNYAEDRHYSADLRRALIAYARYKLGTIAWRGTAGETGVDPTNLFADGILDYSVTGEARVSDE
jgi:hypothetical protein